jgi:hypothetical protein
VGGDVRFSGGVNATAQQHKTASACMASYIQYVLN